MPVPIKFNPKGGAILVKNTILTLVVLLLIAAGAYYLYKNNQTKPMESPVVETTTPTPESTMPEEKEVMSKTVELAAIDPDVVDQSGQAVLTETADGVEVVLTLSAVDETTPQPAHIHEGECPGVGTVAYALESVVNGSSTTVLPDMTLADLMEQLPLAINVHKSATESSVYTACGDITL